MKITKKIFGALTAVMCTVTTCTAAISFSASAASQEVVNQVAYTVYSDHVEVSGIASDTDSVDIVKVVSNLPVTYIQSEAFLNCDSITSVKIPDSVVSIGSKAFKGCSALISAELPTTITSMGYDVFEGTSLFKGQEGPVYYVGTWAVKSDSTKTVNLKEKTQGIADNTFASAGIQTISYIPSTVVTIGNYAFAGNSELKTANLPDGIITIGNGAFSGCDALQSVRISNTATSIGAQAFSGCSSLSKIQIPDSVKRVGADAFAGTVDYKAETGPLFYIGTWVVGGLIDKSQSIEIKKGTKGVADNALNDNEFITSVTIPSGVVTIGDNAFRNCTSLSQLTIPNTVTYIGSNAFSYTSISNIVLPLSVDTIGAYAFYGCKNLATMTIRNAKCNIYPDSTTMPTGPSGVKLNVVENSTALEYAKKYENKYEVISTEVKGDVNSDAKVNMTDLIMLAKANMKKITLTEQQKVAADMNNDSKINITDVILLAKKIMPGSNK